MIVKSITTLQQFKNYGLEKEAELNFKIKSVKEVNGQKKRIIKGYATTSDKDRAADVITPEAIEAAKNDLLKSGARTVFLNHDTDMVIGSVIDTEVDDRGLLVTIEISKAEDVDSTWTKIKEGHLNALSIRLRYNKIRIEEDDTDQDNITYFVEKMELYEVSVVGLPCNPKAELVDVIEKSFRKAIKRRKKMTKSQKSGAIRVHSKKNAATKKKTEKKEQPMTKEDVRSMVGEALKELTPQIVESIKGKDGGGDGDGDAKTKTKKNPDTSQKRKTSKSKTSNIKKKTSEDNKDPLLAAIKDLSTKVGKLSAGTSGKKGFQDTNDDGTPVVESINNEETVKKYCKMWLDTPDVYDSLDDTQKSIARQVYNAMLPELAKQG